VKLKRDFTFLLHVDQHPDLSVARPAARATYSVTATLYAPIRSQIRSGCHGGTPPRCFGQRRGKPLAIALILENLGL
jgi:hypothetical protein